MVSERRRGNGRRDRAGDLELSTIDAPHAGPARGRAVDDVDEERAAVTDELDDKKLLGSMKGRYRQVLVDFYSQQGADARFRFSKASAGARHLNGKWIWYAALKKGLRSDHKGYQNELSLDWGMVLGISRYFDLSRN